MVARLLSVIGHPFVLIPASVTAIGVLRGGDARSARGLVVLFAVVSVGILLGMRRGRFNDFDVSERQRRPGFYTLLSAATLALAFWLRDDAQAFRLCALAAAALAACGLLNRWIKVSLHTAFALYAAGLWAAWSPAAGLLALPLCAAIAWSRVQLGRHSTPEVLAGAAIGLVTAASLLLLAPIAS